MGAEVKGWRAQSTVTKMCVLGREWIVLVLEEE
jgi:hypothetical protein